MNEDASAAVHDWLAARAGVRFAVSDWVAAEFSATLSRKLLIRQMTATLREEAQLQFEELMAGEFDVLPVIRAEFRVAADLARRSAQGLGAGDALYLAIAKSHALTLCTRDIKLAAAGADLGCPTELVGSEG